VQFSAVSAQIFVQIFVQNGAHVHRYSRFRGDAGGSGRTRSIVFSLALLALGAIVVVGAALVVHKSTAKGNSTPFPTPSHSPTSSTPALSAACRSLGRFWSQDAEVSKNGGKTPSGVVLPVDDPTARCSGVVGAVNTTVSGPVVALTYSTSITDYAKDLAAAGWTQSQGPDNLFIWKSAKYPRLLIDIRLDGAIVQVLVAGPLKVLTDR
jgi:hypothetical protein